MYAVVPSACSALLFSLSGESYPDSFGQLYLRHHNCDHDYYDEKPSLEGSSFQNPHKAVSMRVVVHLLVRYNFHKHINVHCVPGWLTCSPGDSTSTTCSKTS